MPERTAGHKRATRIRALTPPAAPQSEGVLRSMLSLYEESMADARTKYADALEALVQASCALRAPSCMRDDG